MPSNQAVGDTFVLDDPSLLRCCRKLGTNTVGILYEIERAGFFNLVGIAARIGERIRLERSSILNRRRVKSASDYKTGKQRQDRLINEDI
jgi:hypothetical protein